MANMTDYIAGILNGVVLRGQSYTGTLLYAALFTVTPTHNTAGTEATYTSYARQPFRTGGQLNTDQFNAISSTTTAATNTQTLTFPANTGTSQTVVGCAVFDAVSGGNMLFFATLATSKSIDPGDVPSFPAASFAATWS